MYAPIDKIHVTQWFGENKSIYAQFGMNGHNGIDFRCKFSDTPIGKRYIYAIGDGKIISVKKNNTGYGLYIRLRLDSGEEVIYGHLSRVDVGKGEKVLGGRVIGLTGNTGFSTAAHLHFGIRPKVYDSNNGFSGYVDPMQYLQGMTNPETGKRMVWDNVDAEDVEYIQENVKDFARNFELCNDENWSKPLTKYETLVILQRFFKIIK